MMNRRTFILTSCASLLALQGAEAQTVSLSDEAIRAILRRRIDVEKRATGMAVGIVERGRRRVIAYGKQDSGDARSVGADTLFEIASVTKVFTALLLADMVHRKELQLDDPVDRYLPNGLRTPQRNGRVITLADLAIHTSGLPLYPIDIFTTPNAGEVLTRFSISDLRSWLANFALSRDPGEQWEYSNLGYSILGLALATKAGTTYDALLKRRIIGPLKLKDTTLYPTEKAMRRLVAGHNEKLAPVPPFEFGIFAPAGGLHSTVDDLLSFLSAVLPSSLSPLEAPARLLLSRRRPAPAVGGEQALGWDVVAGIDPFFAKDGVSVGQTATVVLDAPKQVGVVVLSKAFPVKLGPIPSGGVGAADLARHLIRPALPLG
jgi:CubicO group peptidase (beta-lactamase class C family)